MMTNTFTNRLNRCKWFVVAGFIAMCMNSAVYSQGGGGGGGFAPSASSELGSAEKDPFSDARANQHEAEQFIKKFKGIVRLTYVVRISNVIAHVRSAAAVVISSQGTSPVGTSLPVLATSDSIFDPPNDDWFKDSPADSRTYSVYVQDLPNDFKQRTSIQLFTIPAYGGGMGGLGGAGDFQRNAYGMVSLPGVGDELFPICESANLDDLKSTSGGVAFVFATTTLNNTRLLEISLLKSRNAKGNKEESGSCYSLRDSTIPAPLKPEDQPVDGDVFVTENGFEALILKANAPKGFARVTAKELLSAYVEHVKNSKSTAELSIGASPKEPTDTSSQPLKTDTSKLLAEIIAVYRSSESQNEKSRALAQLEHVLSEQFDAQRNIKKLEIQELRERLNELEKQEELRTKNKPDIIAGKVKQLVRE